MKLTKEDYMRLPKERLAELLVERDNEKVEPIVIPATPIAPEPSRYPYPWGPVITWFNDANTLTAKDSGNIKAE